MDHLVDLMGDTIPSDVDIVIFTEALLAERFPPRAESILIRKVLGKLLGMYELTPAEEAEVGAFYAAAVAARVSGDVERARAALLAEALAIEAAQPIDGATQAVLDLVAQRATYRQQLE
jgi:hypothetical protein